MKPFASQPQSFNYPVTAPSVITANFVRNTSDGDGLFEEDAWSPLTPFSPSVSGSRVSGMFQLNVPTAAGTKRFFRFGGSLP